MKGRSRRTKYSGILAKPRSPWPAVPMLSTENEIKRRIEIDQVEFVERLQAVLRHYAIDHDDPSALTRLLYALLLEHVPGFRRAKGRGRAEFWTDQRMALLFTSVSSMVEAGKSEAEAIRVLVKGGQFGAKSEASLRRRFDEAANSPIVGTLKKLMIASNGQLTWADIQKFGSAENSA